MDNLLSITPKFGHTYSTSSISSSVIMKKPWNSLLLSFCQQLNGEKYYCRNYVLHSFMQNTAIHGIPFVLKVVQVMTTASLLFPEIFPKKKSRIQFQREDICFSNPFSSTNKLSLTFTTISIAMQTLLYSLLMTSCLQIHLSIEFKSGRSQHHPENETKPACVFGVFIWKCILFPTKTYQAAATIFYQTLKNRCTDLAMIFHQSESELYHIEY